MPNASWFQHLKLDICCFSPFYLIKDSHPNKDSQPKQTIRDSTVGSVNSLRAF